MKIEKRIKECEAEVDRISASIKEMEEWLSTPSGAQNQAMFEAYGKLKSELQQAELKWEEAMLESES